MRFNTIRLDCWDLMVIRLDRWDLMVIRQMIETEKQQVKDFRSQGYSDRQLQEIGFCEASIRRAPSVAMAK